MVVTYSRRQKVLAADAPAALRRHVDAGYRELLADLGIASFADLQQGGEELRRFLPQLEEVAEAIIAANPEVLPDHRGSVAE